MKRFAYLFVVSTFLISQLAAPPVAHATPPPDITVEISEVFASPSDISDRFVEIHNKSSTTLSLAGFFLGKSNISAQKSLASLESIAPGEYKIIDPGFSISNGVSNGENATHLRLYYPTQDGEQFHIEAPLPNMSTNFYDTHSWQLIDGEWTDEFAKTPGQAPPEQEDGSQNETTPPPEDELENDPNEEPETETPPPAQACDIENIHLSEIVANPTGSESAGGEFVELYNDNDHPVLVDGCELYTNKSGSDYEFTEVDIIPAKSYKAFIFFNGLLNDGGNVTFAAARYEEVIEYPKLADDQAYALIDEQWQLTKKMTPNEPNALPSLEEASGDIGELLPCPAGKFRNPETNRCKNIASGVTALQTCSPGKVRNPVTNRCRNIASSSSSLASCKAGQYRNSETNRCRNIAAASRTLVPCKPGYERSPSTNRCRKVGTSDESLKPCKEGYERNPETKRCRKTSALGVSTNISESGSSSGNSPMNMALILIAGTFLTFFLVYEYRLSIRDKLAAVRLPWGSRRD